MAFVILFVFVFLFAYGVERERRIRRGQHQLAQLAELLLIRHALEKSASARSEAADSAETQAPQA